MCRAQNVLGEVGKGYKVAIETLNEGRIGIGAQMIGWLRARSNTPSPTQRAEAVRQGDRRVSGRAAPDRRAATELEAARLMVYNAARLRDAASPF